MAGVVGVWRVQKKRGTVSSVKGVPSAERALAVLTAFRQGDGALSLADLAKRTGLVKSTIVRLAASLQHYQLLARLPDGTYRLDAATLRLGVLAVSLPTMLVGFARYSRDRSFVVLGENRRFVLVMAAGSIFGSFIGGRLLLELVPNAVLLPLLAVILVLSAIKVWRHK